MIFGSKTPPQDAELASADTQDGPTSPFEAAWPFNTDSPQVDGILREDAFLSTILVDVTGLEWEAIAGLLSTVRDTAKSKNMVPVFIVDLVDYRGLIAEGLAYDTLPNLAANAPLANDLDWPSYMVWRRHLLREKWLPSAIINLGPNADWDTP